ncbi:hypothetical protein ACFO5O_06520 [Geojedonia litorea]|uniref:Sialidase domain-containing protein n=1 Tax=Geojedonia litorea TaxID=1268269 RepID=A0ABV9N115_9FLAO
MNQFIKPFWTILLALIIVQSCDNNTKQLITDIPSPAAEKSSEPNLHLSKDGNVYLTWIEMTPDTTSILKFSTLKDHISWSQPKTIASGKNWFVNWADFPGMTSFGDTNLATHYLEKSANGTYTYDVKLKFSKDEGKTWGEAIKPHTDNTNTEHGFVSKLALDDDKMLSVWLDGRQYAYAEENDSITKEMTLRSASFNANGEMLNEFVIDSRVCDCCQTDLAMTNEGPIVIYRNRSEDEVRDIYYSKLINDKWTNPKPVFNDNWNIAGCPVNGPSISALGNTVAVIWYTLQNDAPHVKLAFSNNNGNSFETPVTLSNSFPIGRVDVELIDNNSAIVTWVDNVNYETVIQMQRVYKDGSKSEPLTLAKTSESRSSGFPRMVIKDNIVYIAYTLSGKENLSVRTLAIDLEQLQPSKNEML